MNLFKGITLDLLIAAISFLATTLPSNLGFLLSEPESRRVEANSFSDKLYKSAID